MQPRTFCTRTAVLILILALVAAPVSAAADESMSADGYYRTYSDFDELQVARMATDTLLVRPLGIVSTAIGLGLFVVSVPFSALGGNTPEAWHALVVRPAQFTFVRPLGVFEN